MINRNEWKTYAPIWIPTPALVADVDLAYPIVPMTLGSAYRAARILVRIHEQPIGYVDIICGPEDRIDRDRILASLDQETAARALKHLMDDFLGHEQQDMLVNLGLAEMLDWMMSNPVACSLAQRTKTGLTVTVAICTRNRPHTLRHTLNSLTQQTYADFKVIVVDNAPSDDATEQLVCTQFPHVTYVREPEPGLDNARNRAIREARSEILAYIDDDAIADRHWVQALVNTFDTPDIMCVTGLVAPARLDTAAQELFERFGYSKGFYRLRFNLQSPPPIGLFPYKGYHGTGCNSAFRLSVFEHIGLFDPRLDMGTPVPGGGDHDMFTRVILAGYTLVYDPKLVVFHEHIADLSVLSHKLGQYHQAFVAYLTKQALLAPRKALPLIIDACWSTVRKFVRGLAAVIIKRDRPFALVLSQIYYPLFGPLAFYRSHRQFVRRAKASDSLIATNQIRTFKRLPARDAEASDSLIATDDLGAFK